MVGSVLAVVAVLTGAVRLFTETWADVLLFPGILAGFTFYSLIDGHIPSEWRHWHDAANGHHDMVEDAAICVGIFAAGVAYGTIAVLLRRGNPILAVIGAICIPQHVPRVGSITYGNCGVSGLYVTPTPTRAPNPQTLARQ